MNHLLRLSNRSLHAAASFGGSHADPAPKPNDETLRALADLVALASITLILGPSGSGKSRLMRSLASEFVYRGMRAVLVSPNERAIPTTLTPVDLIPGPVQRVRSLLSTCGLSDSRTFSRAARLLSVGETFRLLLARALSTKPEAIFVDEFGGSLDSETLHSLCHTLKRTHPRTRLIIAGVHPQLKAFLKPVLVITCAQGTSPQIEHTGER